MDFNSKSIDKNDINELNKHVIVAVDSYTKDYIRDIAHLELSPISIVFRKILLEFSKNADVQKDVVKSKKEYPIRVHIGTNEEFKKDTYQKYADIITNIDIINIAKKLYPKYQ